MKTALKRIGEALFPGMDIQRKLETYEQDVFDVFSKDLEHVYSLDVYY